jgi:hypothetical protein
MAREELKWRNIDADDLPAAVKKSFDAMVEAEAARIAPRIASALWCAVRCGIFSRSSGASARERRDQKG